MLYQKQGRFKDALLYYKAVVNYEPDNAEAFYLMGQRAMCSDMIQEAKAFFAESFRLSPTPRIAMDLVILSISLITSTMGLCIQAEGERLVSRRRDI
jgi:tetratricopeptide (TPR) repeat protein